LLLQVLVKYVNHCHVADARVIELLKRHLRDRKVGKQPTAREVLKLARPTDVACQLETRAQQRTRGTEANCCRIFRTYGSAIAGKRRIIARSASLIIDELTGTHDNLVEQFLVHGGELLQTPLRSSTGHVRWQLQLRFLS
jgi:hypothetical protein